MPWEWPVGALCAFLLALITTPAGVSGAVLLLPIQLSVLHVPSPAVTPTNLLFNVAAVPGGLLRFRQERRLLNPLTWLLVAGTLPGVIAGAIVRVEWLSGGRASTRRFRRAAAARALARARQPAPRRPPAQRPAADDAVGSGCLSLWWGPSAGSTGSGAGRSSLRSCSRSGYSAYEVAPATLAATFLTSIGGILTYQVLQTSHGGAIAPDWALGVFLGAGGFAGSYLGARLQPGCRNARCASCSD